MMTLLKVTLLMGLALATTEANCQRNIGTLEEVNMEDAYLLISGKRIPYSGDVIVTYMNAKVSPVYLLKGVRVSYTEKPSGSIESVKLLGPSSLLELIHQH